MMGAGRDGGGREQAVGGSERTPVGAVVSWVPREILGFFSRVPWARVIHSSASVFFSLMQTNSGEIRLVRTLT